MTEMVSYFLLHVSFAVKLWMCFCQQGWCYCHCIFHRWLHTYIGKLVSSDCSLSMACLHPLLITGSAPARFMWKSLFGRSALSCDGSWWCPLFAQLAWSGRVCVCTGSRCLSACSRLLILEIMKQFGKHDHFLNMFFFLVTQTQHYILPSQKIRSFKICYSVQKQCCELSQPAYKDSVVSWSNQRTKTVL